MLLSPLSEAPQAWTEDITKKDHVEQFLKGDRKQKGQATARSSGLMSEVVVTRPGRKEFCTCARQEEATEHTGVVAE